MAIDFPNSPTLNQIYQSGDKTWIYDGEKWTIYIITAVVDSTPVGALQAYAGATAPTGWLMAYGQAVNRSTYSGLFNVLGTLYGAGDGSTTFNLPDLRGRVPAGLDNMGGSAASRLTSGTSGITGTLLGATGGDERVHQHTHIQNAHDHWIRANSFAGDRQIAMGPVGGDGDKYGVADSATDASTTTALLYADSRTPTNQNFGAGSAQNVQPTIVMNYIIKYGPSDAVNAASSQIFLPTQIFS